MSASGSRATPQQLHDRLGAMIDQIGHPDYSLRELADGLRDVRDALFTLSAITSPRAVLENYAASYDGMESVSGNSVAYDIRQNIIPALERKVAQSATRAISPSPDTLWMVYFEDTDLKAHPEIFFGPGAEEAARRRYKEAYDNWSCHLLARVPTHVNEDGSPVHAADSRAPSATLSTEVREALRRARIYIETCNIQRPAEKTTQLIAQIDALLGHAADSGSDK